ncbi:hypothetical protein [Chondromyces apiculatus]|nr:hypothetical protein [Chondromyces apiculatus]
MSSLLGLNVEKLLPGIPDKPLGAPEIPVSLGKGAVEEPVTLALAGVNLAIAASAEATVEAFNAPGDVDREGIIADKPSATADANDPTRATPVLFLGKHGWLKYAVRVQAKATGEGSMPYLSGSGSGETTALIADYRTHALTENTRTAVAADIMSLRLPFLADHVASLKIDEALVLRVGGNLSTSLTLRWADVFSTNLTALGRLIPAGSALGLTIAAGASVTGLVRLADTFNLVFYRSEAGRIRVLVQKASAREVKVDAALAVTLEATDPAAMREAVTGALDALVGTTGLQRFEALLAKLNADDLTAEERAILQRILDRIGLAHLEQAPAELRHAWEELKTKTRETLVTLATEKMTAGFTYEYERLAENATLAELNLSDTRLRELHPQLITLQLASVLAHLSRDELTHYLHQQTLTASQAWGFSLGLRTWSVLGSKDGKTLREVRLYNTPDHVAGPQKIAFLGARTYEGSLLGWKAGWGGDLKAGMTRFRPHPTASDFSYGLYLHIARGGALTEQELREAIDEGAIWGAYPTSDIDEVLTKIKATAAGRPVRARLEMRLDDDLLFREIVRLLSTGPRDPYARALARALPWTSNLARNTPETRTRIYAPLWALYLQDKGRDWTPTVAARNAEYHLKQRHPDASDYRLWEREQRAGSLADVIGKESRSGGPNDYLGIYRKWSAMTVAMLRLHQAIQTRTDWTNVKVAFQSLDDLWKNSFELRTFGALLLDVAAQTAIGSVGIERTLTVTLGEGTSAHTLTYGTAHPDD